MQLIIYAGEAVALVLSGDLAIFDPELEPRGHADPLLRFATAMCRLALELELGLAQGLYDGQRAKRYARELLMPAA